MYFISSGEVEVRVADRKDSADGGRLLRRIGAASGKPRSADVIALDYSKFVTLNQNDFRQFLRRFPEIRQQVAALAAERGEMNEAFFAEGEETK